MKIQCEVCEKAEGKVLCCSDEAVLCKLCDEQVHAANKLSQRHHRVALLKHAPSSSASSGVPLCDICQERNGYFLCLEDRALLCKNCDSSIHMATSHQRFLVAGVQVSLQPSTNNSDDTNHFKASTSHRTCPEMSVSDTSLSNQYTDEYRKEEKSGNILLPS